MAKVATTRAQRLNPRAEELAPAGPGAEWSVARSLGGEPGPIGLVGTLDPAGRDVLNPATMDASRGAVIQSYAAIDYLGRSTASGDINGDGHVDLILGAGQRRGDGPALRDGHRRHRDRGVGIHRHLSPAAAFKSLGNLHFSLGRRLPK